jgi:hypothetical protein
VQSNRPRSRDRRCHRSEGEQDDDEHSIAPHNAERTEERPGETARIQKRVAGRSFGPAICWAGDSSSFERREWLRNKVHRWSRANIELGAQERSPRITSGEHSHGLRFSGTRAHKDPGGPFVLKPGGIPT